MCFLQCGPCKENWSRNDGKKMSIRVVFIAILLFHSTSYLFGQNYGLEFIAREKNLDYRTELDLRPSGSFEFKNDFELSFDLLLRKKVIQTSYFGYILRVISADQYNIDLMHNKIFVDSVDLNLVFGEDIPKVSYDFDNTIHFDHWINIRLRFNISKHELEIILPDTSIIQSDIPIDYKQPIKFIFGACDYGHFKTRDIPPFNLRDVKIIVDEKLRYHWPLNEFDGTEARDVIQDEVALVRNPNWIKKMHSEWKYSYQGSMKGAVQVAVNRHSEIIYLIGEEELIDYSIPDDSYKIIKYKNRPTLLHGSQAVYFSRTNSIYCYNINSQIISVFNLKNHTWHVTGPVGSGAGGYHHHNKYLSQSDSLLYLFGGYGYHEYKNEVHRLNLSSKQWEVIQGDWDELYKPRYLAALGEHQDTIYILGGYGSPSGDQMISPQNYHELIAYSITDNRFVHKFDLEMPVDDFVFGNSMVIDSASNHYYALAFSRFKADNSIQLIRGDLDEPTIELMADEIPFTHSDINSYVDLFYFPVSKYLLTYNGITDSSGNTSIELHKLKFPPNSSQLDLQVTAIINQSKVILFLLLFSFLAIIVYVYSKKRKPRKQRIPDNLTSPAKPEMDDSKQILNELRFSETENHGIHCFGGFRVYDRDGYEITGKFTPLIKELFLLILLHTLKDDKGISSEKLTEILWYDKGPERAANNRAVNIAKLRTILEEIGNCEITHDTGYWKIIFKESEIYNDYLESVRITQTLKNRTKFDILKLIKITKKGPFLGNVSYEWLDAFKSTSSENILGTLIAFAEELNLKEDAHLIILIADCICHFDTISEDAMILKCKAQHAIGSHSLAKSTYNHFTKEYKKLYDEEYGFAFSDIINKSKSEIITA